MTIYPAIDIKGGRCVRLTQGLKEQETVYATDPVEVARSFRAAGATWIHVVDLDGAFSGEPQNTVPVAAIAQLGLKVQLGGGLRTRGAVDKAIGLGVSRVVIGTRAAESQAFVEELVNAYTDKVAVGIDSKNGFVAVKGWVNTTHTTTLDLARRMDSIGVRTLIHTDIGTDGMLTGPNFGAQEALLAAVGCGIIASGGVSRREDVEGLAALAGRRANLDGVIVGKAIYEKRVDLADLLALAR